MKIHCGGRRHGAAVCSGTQCRRPRNFCSDFPSLFILHYLFIQGWPFRSSNLEQDITQGV
jgi:hypothetical protein